MWKMQQLAIKIGEKRDSPLEWIKIKYQKLLQDFPFIDNSNVYPICNHLRDIGK